MQEELYFIHKAIQLVPVIAEGGVRQKFDNFQELPPIFGMCPSSEVVIYGSGHAQLPFTGIMISKWHFADLFVAEENNFCSQVLKSGLIQRANGAFWRRHRVCCYFVPEDKCQAWVFALWLLYLFLKYVLTTGLWVAVSKEKWCYRTHYLANWNMFLVWSFSFTKAAERSYL